MRRCLRRGRAGIVLARCAPSALGRQSSIPAPRTFTLLCRARTRRRQASGVREPSTRSSRGSTEACRPFVLSLVAAPARRAGSRWSRDVRPSTVDRTSSFTSWASQKRRLGAHSATSAARPAERNTVFVRDEAKQSSSTARRLGSLCAGVNPSMDTVRLWDAPAAPPRARPLYGRPLDSSGHPDIP